MISKTDCDFVIGLNVKCEGTTFSCMCCFPRQLLLM